MLWATNFDRYICTGFGPDVILNIFNEKQFYKKQSYLRTALHNMTVKNLYEIDKKIRVSRENYLLEL